MDKRAKVDVVILGGGLAGPTLAMQVLDKRPGTRVTVLEKQQYPVTEAAHKVGESTIEVGAHYFAEVLGLKKVLRTAKLPKLGLRYFFNGGEGVPIERRMEVGQSHFPVVGTHNFDRGRMENIIRKECVRRGVRFIDGANVKDVELGEDEHRVEFIEGEQTHVIRCRWVVDAMGRKAFLKRRLKLGESNDHDVNAVWFRIDAPLSLDAVSDDTSWQSRVPFGLRKLSTNHLMGEGYWVWLIPLSSGSLSVGIVADERVHPLREMQNFELALDWLKRHEPECAQLVQQHREQLLDFRALRHFSYGCSRVFSAERWCLTGEAGVFLDPFYSPGSDFIAFGNEFVSSLVASELDGQDIRRRVEYYNTAYLNLYSSYLLLYQNQYLLMGNARVFGAKIVWDFALYWGSTALIYFRRKLADVEFMESVVPLRLRFFRLNEQVQRFFERWHAYDKGESYRDAFINYLEVELLYDWQTDLEKKLSDEELRVTLEKNLRLCENLVRWMYRSATGTVERLVPDDPAVDPYRVGSADLAAEAVRPPSKTVEMVTEINEFIARCAVIPVVQRSSVGEQNESRYSVQAEEAH